jgi:hypothetical protein
VSPLTRQQGCSRLWHDKLTSDQMPHFHSSLCMFLLNSSLSLSLSPPPIQLFEGLSPIQIGLPFSAINASISSVSLKPCSFWTKLRSQRPFHPVSQPQCQMLSDLQTSAHQNYFVDAWTTRRGVGESILLPPLFSCSSPLFALLKSIRRSVACAMICCSGFSCSPILLWFLACQIFHAIAKKSSSSPSSSMIFQTKSMRSRCRGCSSRLEYSLMCQTASISNL